MNKEKDWDRVTAAGTCMVKGPIKNGNKCKIFPKTTTSAKFSPVRGGHIRPFFLHHRDRALKERQCTLQGQARYVNVRGSVHWKGVYRVGDSRI